MASLISHQVCSPAEALHTSQGERSSCALRASEVGRSSVWVLALWNVRSQLAVERSVETARQANDLHVVTYGRKIDQVVSELGKYRIMWLRCRRQSGLGRLCTDLGSVMLVAGRAVPVIRTVKQRGERVAIILSGLAIGAWKSGESHWRVWSFRLVTAILKVGSGRSDCLHILLCYAPIYVATREEKNEFFDTLQHALSEIQSDNGFVMLGDFNARVGTKVDEGDQWSGMSGPLGHGSLNEALKACPH